MEEGNKDCPKCKGTACFRNYTKVDGKRVRLQGECEGYCLDCKHTWREKMDTLTVTQHVSERANRGAD